MFDAEPGLIHREQDMFSVYGYQNVNLVVWQTMNIEAVRKVDEVHARRHLELGRRLSFISVLTPQVGFPDSEVRAEVQELQARWRAGIGCFVAVLEADGMWRSALRGFLAALQALAPQSDGRVHLAGSLGYAAAWLIEPHARVTGVRLDRAALKEFLERARRTAPALRSATTELV